ncbi:MAG: hypothetical protein ACE15F_08700 [bacterium]
MKRCAILLLVAAWGCAAVASALSQPAVSPDGVVHCRSLEDVKKARESGVQLFEFRGRYWVKVDAEYKGSFKDLETAKKVLQQYRGKQLPASGPVSPATQPAAAASQPAGKVQGATGLVYFYPELVLYPFVQLTSEGTQQLQVPGNERVDAAKVMIHPEPFVFSEISFGMIDPNLIGRLLHAEEQRLKELGIAPPTANPQNSENRYFAVTGTISPRESVTVPGGALTYWVGAAVVGNDGSVLWQNYGPVDNEGRFKCFEQLIPTAIPPQFLLLFTLAKGALATNLRPTPDYPSLDASAYPYHVLASTTLKLDANWLPPLDEVMREEYMKLQEAVRRGQPLTPGVRSPGNPKTPKNIPPK